MVYLSFSPALEVAVAAETKRTCFKENLEVEAVVAVEPLLCTLTLKKPMILIQTATY